MEVLRADLRGEDGADLLATSTRRFFFFRFTADGAGEGELIVAGAETGEGETGSLTTVE